MLAKLCLLIGRCGLGEGVAEKAEAADKDWRVSGKYAVVSFSKKR